MLWRAAYLTIVCWLLVAKVLAGSANALSSDKSIEISEGFVKTLTLDQAAETVAIGNPGLLDATVAGGQTIVLTAKARGITNVAILGKDGALISHLTVRIEPAFDASHRISVRSGRAKYQYFCDPGCKLVRAVGSGAAVVKSGSPTGVENTQPNGPSGGQP
jgi:hypothetical protein